MKKVLPFVFLLITTGLVQADNLRQSNGKGTSLIELLEQLESQTAYRFFYDKDELRELDVSFIQIEAYNIEEILAEIERHHPVKFYIKGTKVSVRVEHESVPVRSIKGTVLDESGEPLIGVTVQIKETGEGTITDFDGAFVLEVGGIGETIEFSYIGYKTAVYPIGDQAIFNVTMKPDATALDEVVVYGYGSGTKEKFNGAVSKIDEELLNNYSSANFEQGLMGTMAGVQILGNTKNPGENSVIQIRGVNTLTAGTEPLIVVDGNPLTEGTSFSSISANDIESVNVLKDAASAAVYGSRASNGVILITTKKGKEGNLSVTYDGYVGFQERIDKFELADAYETALFDWDARNYGYVSGGEGRNFADDNDARDANGGGKRSRLQPFLADYINRTPGLTNTNWVDAVFRSALQTNHYLNLSGGNERTNYSVSFGYLDQENIVIGSDYKRYTTSVQLNSDISDRVRFGISTNIAMTDENPTGSAGWSRSREDRDNQADPAFSVVVMQPYYPIYNADGTYTIAAQLDDNNENWDGPISENTIAQVGLSDFTRNTFRVFGNTYVAFDIHKDLTFKASLGGDFSTRNQEYFGPSTFGNYRTPVASNPARAHKRERNRENYIFENNLTYAKSFGKHSFNALALFSYQQEVEDRLEVESQDFPDDNIRNIAGATSTKNPENFEEKWALESYLARLEYSYDNRYYLSGSWRRDGSSRFGSNTKYGDFTSLSAGWTLSNESFFPQSDLISFAKVRFSWGETGNNQIGNYAALALVDKDEYVFDETLSAGNYTSTSPNEDLSWETNTAFNYGIDLGFWNNKILLTAEYYDSKTSDLLLEVPVPQQSGFSQSLQNIGELQNQGFEFELSGRGFNLGQLGIGFNVNISTNRNKVLSLGAGQTQIIQSNGVDFITRVGEPIAQFYNFQVIGVYKTQAEIDGDPIAPLSGTEVGDYIVLDANGDGLIDPSDRVLQGDYSPELTYGFGFNIGFKGFDVVAQFNGVDGRKVSDNMVNRSESGEGFFVPSKYYFDNYFNDRNPDGFFRRPDFSSFSSAGRLTRKSNLAVLDADYFRLRSVQIGYSVPKRLTNNWGIEALRLYITGNNIFNISDYRGYNPDAIDNRTDQTGRQTLTRGYIFSTSPLTRFLAFGINLQF